MECETKMTHSWISVGCWFLNHLLIIDHYSLYFGFSLSADVDPNQIFQAFFGGGMGGFPFGGPAGGAGAGGFTSGFPGGFSFQFG